MLDYQVITALETAAQAALTTAQTALTTAQACLIVCEQIKADRDTGYVSLQKAAIALGDGVSPDMLKQRCIDGRFTHGKEFINTSDSNRGNYLIKVSAARRYLETDPSRRPVPKTKRQNPTIRVRSRG
jgi:hypothetical protein